MLNKDKYFNKIEKRKFKNSSPFAQKQMVIDAVSINIILNIVNDLEKFNTYVLNLNDCKENIGYLIIPTLSINFNEKLFEVFDLFILDHNLCVEKKIDDIEFLDKRYVFYKNKLLLKKNIHKLIKLEINSKINLKRIT